MKCHFFCDVNKLPNLHDHAKTSPKKTLRKYRDNFFRNYAPFFIQRGGIITEITVHLFFGHFRDFLFSPVWNLKEESNLKRMSTKPRFLINIERNIRRGVAQRKAREGRIEVLHFGSRIFDYNLSLLWKMLEIHLVH